MLRRALRLQETRGQVWCSPAQPCALPSSVAGARGVKAALHSRDIPPSPVPCPQLPQGLLPVPVSSAIPPQPAPAGEKILYSERGGSCGDTAAADPPSSPHCHFPLCTKSCVLASLPLIALGLGTGFVINGFWFVGVF